MVKYRTCFLLIFMSFTTFSSAYAASTFEQVSFRTVALSEQPAPGTDPATDFLVFESIIGQDGYVTLRSQLIPGFFQYSWGIWSEGPQGLELVTRSGLPAPDLDSSIVIQVPSFEEFSLFGPGVDQSNNEGVWSIDTDSIHLIARKGQQLPGASTGSVISSIDSQSVRSNHAGRIAFAGSFVGPTSSGAGLWSNKNGVLETLALSGSQAPGTEFGIVYNNIENDLVMNDFGRVAFRAGLEGPGIRDRERFGIWSDVSGSLELIVRGNDSTAPGLIPGSVLWTFSSVAINNAGKIGFVGNVLEPSFTRTNYGIWIAEGQKLESVVARGDLAPGAGPNAFFDRVNDLVMNDAGDVMFFGELRRVDNGGTAGTGIWAGTPDDLQLIARGGRQAPGVEPGVVFRGFNSLFNMNASGQVVFMATLSGASVTDDNDRGIWATSPDGELVLIIREGDVIDVNDDPLIDDLRTVRFLDDFSRSGGQDGRRIIFNDNGQLALDLTFYGQTYGSFVATVPEPASFILLSFLLFFSFNRRSIA